MDTTDLALGTTGAPSVWHGVLRHKRTVLWTCPHDHHNRDVSSMHQYSARDCANIARRILAGWITAPATATTRAEKNWQELVLALADSLSDIKELTSDPHESRS